MIGQTTTDKLARLRSSSANNLGVANLENRRVPTFPGGSKSRVNAAGDRVREGTATSEDIAVIDTWREAHRHVINSFQAILRTRTRGRDIVVAQRHKRRRTIIDKLTRIPKMQLSRMDDVAGCRLIFQTVEDLRRFRAEFHDKSRFNHALKNHPNKYDYIIHPKESGYRGIHDVYVYDVNSESGRARKGLLIELQYRTVYQHAWATCVEVVGFLTDNQPKFNRGSTNIRRILRVASEIIARSHESQCASLPELSNREITNEFKNLDAKLRFLNMLGGLNQSTSLFTASNNFILMFSDDEDSGGNLAVHSYRRTTDALRALFVLEREYPKRDIVLVRGDKPEDVREAFKNYFSDAIDFIALIEDGCTALEKAPNASYRTQ